MTTYEYLTVTYCYRFVREKARWYDSAGAEVDGPRGGAADRKATERENEIEQMFVIERPDREPQTIVRFHSKGHHETYRIIEDNRSASGELISVLNLVGSEGWKMVSSSILDSSIFSDSDGFGEYGSPIREQWIFMREKRTGQ